MAINLTKLWDVLNNLLEAGNDFVKAQIETAYGALHSTLKAKAESTDSPFDDNSLITVELGVRDKLNELYPFDKYPPK